MTPDEEDLEFDRKLETCSGAAISLMTFMAVVVMIVGVNIWRLLVVILAGPVGYLLAWRRYGRR